MHPHFLWKKCTSLKGVKNITIYVNNICFYANVCVLFF